MSSPYEIRLIVHRYADSYRAAWTTPEGQLSEDLNRLFAELPDLQGDAAAFLLGYVLVFT